jgi:hypothetical protein
MFVFRARTWISALGRAHTVIGVVLLLATCLVESPYLRLFAEPPQLGFYVLFAGLTLSMVASHQWGGERSVARR